MTAIMIDVDHFKSINDTFGHQTGDAVIKELAEAIHNALPEHSTCFRYGGEEFLIIIQNESEAGIRVLADDLLACPTQLRFEVTVSIGIKHATQALGSVEQLINDADQALYSSKKKGRNCVSWSG